MSWVRVLLGVIFFRWIRGFTIVSLRVVGFLCSGGRDWSPTLSVFTGRGGKNVGFVAASDEEVRPKNVYVVPAAAAAREKTLKPRKMVVDKTIILNKKAEEKLMARGKHTTFRRITLSGNKNVNFVAFTEDYHKPRHHPPKNN
ncbi:hypothetical protein Hanom_Chr16g01509391 [Helianthus anomalus]